MMKLILTKKPKNVTIIEGFPGFGLIGTIATEFLMEHLQTEKIGTVEIDDIPAMVAIHGGKVVEPVSIHYNKKHNLVLVHALNVGKNAGWQLADVALELAKQVTAKEIISLEGVGSPSGEDNRIFYYTSKKNTIGKLEGMASPLMEGVIVGVTGALLAKNSLIPQMALFAEARSNLPDSKAAAHIIQALDAYLGLEINPQPLLKQAQQFEAQLRGMLQKGQKAQEIQEEKHLSYVG
ncbi:proteasome assembly chaperone family protein [Candidatus Woesearchaeota archaeon]|nr:proteasome assembly chaperone family protein [Candidatus Woesearchaeota archaeon]